MGGAARRRFLALRRRRRDLAAQRVRLLAEQALERLRRGDLALARRYISLIRGLKMRYRLRRLPLAWCKGCLTPYLAGVSVRVRMSAKGYISYTCLLCGRVNRKPIRGKM
jgi:ribonuclease P protein subunit RPR2